MTPSAACSRLPCAARCRWLPSCGRCCTTRRCGSMEALYRSADGVAWSIMRDWPPRVPVAATHLGPKQRAWGAGRGSDRLLSASSCQHAVCRCVCADRQLLHECLPLVCRPVTRYPPQRQRRHCWRPCRCVPGSRPCCIGAQPWSSTAAVQRVHPIPRPAVTRLPGLAFLHASSCGQGLYRPHPSHVPGLVCAGPVHQRGPASSAGPADH